ncbi:polysaccharide biosynthesis protein [Petrocella sp. FN5]|uniref:polysaccharide biosynthesis protein n=1 Tax=Petrocella sp. FN5 TaxID=3032002 RepID=UPI0023DC5EF9|nr:nucleoside-diphosphate sugar epimerase/dehydratase [Petrocella sp. FN5]MDF1616969.1 nucleoside-diphosphate sugar epimerase/dehydratase [Petrocella sp. FN5]
MVTKIKKQVFLLITDILAVNGAFLISWLLHTEGNIPYRILISYVGAALILTIGKLLVYKQFGLYNSLWAYASIEELLKVVVAGITANILGTIYLISMGVKLYFGVYLIGAIFEIAIVGSIRFSYRFFRRIKNNYPINRQEYTNNILIVGSGASGSLIAGEIKSHSKTYGQVIGFIDDEEHKLYKTIGGIKVLGNYHDIYSVTHRFNIHEIIIALPSSTTASMKQIIEECNRSEANVRIIPDIHEIIDGKVSLSKIRDVEIEDLLGRDMVNLNVSEVANYIQDKVIMITGGGGSIGSELCRQIARFLPSKLIILDVYENNAYDIQNELLRAYGDELNLDVIIASVRDRDNIFSIVEEHAPHVIFHAAAHKHVPLMERAPKEAIKNNVFGTKNVAEAAHKFGVERFVMVSTDKAVNPTNIMGASKRICEMIIQGLAKESETKFTAVRFGNVLGSNGSVIPLFKKQIEAGGPITVTHKEIIRYFMTISEAAQLVIQSGAIAKGGETFVLDMGEPVKIYDLAVDLIRLSGLKLNEDIKIKITGLRPGEKLYEELLMDEEGLMNTNYEKIHIGQPIQINYRELKSTLNELLIILKSPENESLIEMIQDIVPTYRNNLEVNNENKYTKEVEPYKLSLEAKVLV